LPLKVAFFVSIAPTSRLDLLGRMTVSEQSELSAAKKIKNKTVVNL
jgi:hypothetical protein